MEGVRGVCVWGQGSGVRGQGLGAALVEVLLQRPASLHQRLRLLQHRGHLLLGAKRAAQLDPAPGPQSPTQSLPPHALPPQSHLAHKHSHLPTYYVALQLLLPQIALRSFRGRQAKRRR